MHYRNEKMREAKRKLILDKSRGVFGEKGFSAVTMQDLVDACDISRGGIYLYFSSVEDVFRELILQRERWMGDRVQSLVSMDIDYETLLDEYLLMQKNRLLNIDDSLLRAMYEFQFSRKDDTLRQLQINNAKATIATILTYGLDNQSFKTEAKESLVQTVLVFLEGLSIYTLLGDVKRHIILQQLQRLKQVMMHG